MTEARDDPRRDLTDRLVEHAAHNGLADTSLRELATAVDTSHRMLIYHFGNRAGVVAAVVERVEAQQRDALAAIVESAIADPTTVDDPASATQIIERHWEQLSDPAVAPFIRLFFEVTASAMFGRPGTEGFLDGLTEPWIELATELGARLADGAAPDPAELRLGIAVVRGLLLDAVASGDPGPATESLQLFSRRFSTR